MILFFSVICPTFNRANLISLTIQSVLNQTFTNFELIIVNDGSTDNTEDVVRSFEDSRIKYYKKANQERAAARNYGVDKASGEYLTFLDSDDLLYPEFLDSAYQFILSNKQVSMFHLAYEIKNGRGKVLRKVKHVKPISSSILEGNILSCLGVVMRREIVIQNKFNENGKLTGTEDWLLWLQLSARHEILSNNKISAALIQHKDRSVMSFNLNKLQDRTQILVEELSEDKVFISKFGLGSIMRIQAHMFSYISLHAAIAKKRMISIKYLLKAARLNVQEFFKKRTLAIIKHLI